MKHNRIRTKKQREARQMEKWTTRARKGRFLRLVRGIVDRSKGAPVAEVHAIYIGHKWGPEIIAREANRRLLQNDLRRMKEAGIKNDPAGRFRAMGRVIARTFLFEQSDACKRLSASLVPAAASLSAMTKAYTTFRVQLEESGRLVKPENLDITELNPARARGQNIQYELVDCLHRTNPGRRYCYALDPEALWNDPMAIEIMRARVAEKMNEDIIRELSTVAVDRGRNTDDRF